MALQAREKRTLILGGCVLFFLAMLYYFYLDENSLFNQWTNLREEVSRRENELARITREQVRYHRLRQEIGQVTGRLAGADREATLKGYLERVVKEQAPSAQLKRMPSRDETVMDLYRQTQVTIDLENITIPELVGIMSAMEASDQGIKIQGFKVTLSRRAEDQLDAVITALAARPLK